MANFVFSYLTKSLANHYYIFIKSRYGLIIILTGQHLNRHKLDFWPKKNNPVGTGSMRGNWAFDSFGWWQPSKVVVSSALGPITEKRTTNQPPEKLAIEQQQGTRKINTRHFRNCHGLVPLPVGCPFLDMITGLNVSHFLC